VPVDYRHGAPVSKQALNDARVDFMGLVTYDRKHFQEKRIIAPLSTRARDLRNAEWDYKIRSEIRPDMTASQIRKELKKIVGNKRVALRVMLWGLVDEAMKGEAAICGRIQVHGSENGRIIRMCGLKPVAQGWRVQTLILDATGDAELLRS